MKLDVTKAWVSQALEHDRILTCCRFSPCGRYLAAGGHDLAVSRWDLESGEKTTLTAHESWVGALAFQSDPPRLFTSDYHGALYAWPYQDKQPQPVWSRKDAHAGWIRALAVSPAGTLASAGSDGVIRLWATANGKPLQELVGHKRYVFSLAFHPDGRSLVSGDLLGNIHHWNCETGELLRNLDASALHTRGDDFLADVGGARCLAFDATGTLLACGGMTDAKSNTFCPGKPAILVFDWDTGMLRQTLRPKHTSDGPVQGLAFLSDGMLAGHAEHLNGESSLEFWSPDQPASTHMIKRQSGYCLDVHPDGLRMAAATFKSHGRGGNGRHSNPAEYASHDGEIAVFSLFAK